MIHSSFKFKKNGYDIKLKFNSRITLIQGDSGTGKTYIYQILDTVRIAKEYNNIVCYNSRYLSNEHASLLDKIQNLKDKLIVIDNAEIILGSKERKYIMMDHSNQYIIFGRDVTGLGLSERCIGELRTKRNSIELVYPLYEKLLKDGTTIHQLI